MSTQDRRYPEQRPGDVGGTTQLTRQQRRTLKRHSAGVDEITQGDRRYFERFAGRRHRIRRMAAAEIASAEAVDLLLPIPPGRARFTLVKNLAPGCRLRIFIHGPADQSGDETSEALAEGLWERQRELSPWIAERESMMLAAFEAASAKSAGDSGDATE